MYGNNLKSPSLVVSACWIWIVEGALILFVQFGSLQGIDLLWEKKLSTEFLITHSKDQM